MPFTEKGLFQTFTAALLLLRRQGTKSSNDILLSLLFGANPLAIRSWLTRKHIQRLHTAATVIKRAWHKWRVSI